MDNIRRMALATGLIAAIGTAGSVGASDFLDVDLVFTNDAGEVVDSVPNPCGQTHDMPYGATVATALVTAAGLSEIGVERFYHTEGTTTNGNTGSTTTSTTVTESTKKETFPKHNGNLVARYNTVTPLSSNSFVRTSYEVAGQKACTFTVRK